MVEVYQKSSMGLAALLACGLMVGLSGCGGPANDAETTAVVAKSQQSARQQWDTAKANGTDKNKGNPSKSRSSGQGHTLGPAGAN